MKLRGNKHWELLTDNEKPCDCGRTTRIAMLGIGEKNKGILLCKRCALHWNEAEKRIGDEIKALLILIRGHLISFAVIFTLIVACNVFLISCFNNQEHKNSVAILTEWAYPKVDQRVSKFQVQRTVEAHRKHSKMPEHTLAVVMAESRFFPGATNNICKDAWGQGQVRWTVWKDVLMEQGIIENDERDLFDIEVSAQAMSYILNHYLGLIPDDLRTPGVKIVYALEMYVGDREGKAVMKELVRRNGKLSDDELKKIIAQLTYPTEVLAYVGEMSALRRDTNIIKQVRAWVGALLYKEKEGKAEEGDPANVG